jgi:hypothetical protein
LQVCETLHYAFRTFVRGFEILERRHYAFLDGNVHGNGSLDDVRDALDGRILVLPREPPTHSTRCFVDRDASGEPKLLPNLNLFEYVHLGYDEPDFLKHFCVIF